MKTRIIGTGRSVPDFVATNDYMSSIVDTNDAWISERTGIRERRLAGAETTVSLATEAGRKALAGAGVSPEEIDLLIVATLSPDDYFPSTACSVQAALGTDRATAFDINAACSGFLFALNTADAYIQAGFCKKALIIGSEVMSKMVDWTDRGTCILFGDGAGAAVVCASENGIIERIQGSDGAKGSVLACANRPVMNPLHKDEKDTRPDMMHMDGQEVFKFAVKKVPECIQELLDKAEIEKDEIKYYILHQANSRILQSVAKRLKEPEEKFPMDLDKYGNTSAASLPILLDELNEQGKLQKGDKVILSGFGAGLTWGAVLLEW